LAECYRWSERALRALDEASCGGREEMQLQATLGVSLMYTRGFTDAAHTALTRSLAIAEERRDVPNQVALLGALSLCHHRKTDLRMGLQYAKRSQSLAGNIEVPAVSALAHGLLGAALHAIGALTDARVALESSLHHWSRCQRTSTPKADDPSLAIILASTAFPQSYSAAILARNLWLQGFPVQAAERTDQLVRTTEHTDQPASRAGVLAWAPGIFLWNGDFEAAERYTDSSIALADSYSLVPFVTLGRAFRAALAIRRSDAVEGVKVLGDCVEMLQSQYKLPITFLNVWLAEGLGTLGRSDEGVALINETIRSVQANQELTFMPELLRVKGSLLLSMPYLDSKAAEACFAQSLELSRRQGARAWELRTAIDLARLWAKSGKSEDGRKLLQPILEQFTEGHDTADLQTAERLLANLRRANRSGVTPRRR